ncbi:MAG: diversity-generating retroelement protein Avd, partial [Planctomycetota bacterium]
IMAAESPVVLVKWYDLVKWFLERVDSFPKNQRFVFGQRLADRAIDVLELLVESAYSPRKADLLSRANRDIEVLRRLVRLAKDRDLFTMRQYGFACKGLTECGRMVGGWLKQSAGKESRSGFPA